MSATLSEQFTEHYLREHSGQDFKSNLLKNALKLCQAFQLDEHPGFVLTRVQFDYLSKIFTGFPQTGLWSFVVYPKSGHVSFGHYHTYQYNLDCVFPTRGLSTNFPYFKWTFGPKLPEDWVKFQAEIESTDCEYIAVMNGSGDVLLSYDSQTGKQYQLQTHIGGGRNYYEPSARPFQNLGDYDVVDEIKDLPVYTKSSNKR